MIVRRKMCIWTCMHTYTHTPLLTGVALIGNAAVGALRKILSQHNIGSAQQVCIYVSIYVYITHITPLLCIVCKCMHVYTATTHVRIHIYKTRDRLRFSRPQVVRTHIEYMHAEIQHIDIRKHAYTSINEGRRACNTAHSTNYAHTVITH